MLLPRFITILLTVFVIINTTPLHAQNQCFSNAQSAYAYLIEQQQQQKLRAKMPNQGQAININTADEATLAQLKGIGSKKAQAIIQYRQQMGGFTTIADLANVKGIGAKTVAKNRQYLTIH